ncbi:lipocalin family protein [Psychroserpens sp. XS_ASV72]|uniref:lipocalin family protein n=1 Tax=Psychroserpens sp. XS_ASV72 TaxID=3241293 RepID=UPI003515B807
MTVLKRLGIICLVLLTSACSSDDDSGGDMQGDINVASLLQSGKWYQESITPGSFTDCEKNTNIEFNDNGAFFLESFDEDSGPCASTGVETGTFTRMNNDISITVGATVINVVIDSISQESLTVTTSDGDTITFDKVQG